MSIPTALESLSTTAASNGPSGSDQRTLADDGLRQAYAFLAQVTQQGADITSSSTITPTSVGWQFDVTGTTGISTISSTNSWNGRLICVQFDGALTLTHSSNLYLPGAANITTVAGDVALFLQRGSGAWQCINFQRKDGSFVGYSYLPLAGGTLTGNLIVSSATPQFKINETDQASDEKLWKVFAAGAVLKLTATDDADSTDREVLTVSRTGGAVSTIALGNSTNKPAISTNGPVTINAPDSGASVNSNSVAGGVAYKATVPTGTEIGLEITNGTGTFKQYFTSNDTYLSVINNANLIVCTNNVDRLIITNDGRIYGTALHNNAGAVTGTTNQYIASGTYTPTLTGVNNISSTSGPTAIWMRVGNVVTVSGQFRADPTNNGAVTTLGISLPIASNFTDVGQCSGTAIGFNGSSQMQYGGLTADTTNDRINLDWIELASGADNLWTFQCTYLVA